ncbi:hypothetical protein BsWGS_14024 [Bradybaena similaris]
MRLEGVEYSYKNPEEQRWNSTAGYNPKNISILTALNDDMFRRLAPTVVVLVAVMIVGVVGNILICYIFTRKLRRNSQNFLLLCLGIFDLLSSCVGVPSEIFDVRHYYLYESVEMCKAMRFLTTFPSLASILVLLVIAVDRYRKICKPLHHQIHLSHARIALIIIVVIAFTFSVPALYIYGHRSFPTPVADVYGYDCSVDDVFKDKPYPLVYEGVFLAAFLVCTVVLASIYIRIWLETRRHIKYLETHATFGTGIMDETTTTSSLNFEDSSLENMLEDGSQARTKKPSHRSLLKKRSTNHSHRKVSSSSTYFRGADRAARPQVPAVIRLTKKTSQHGVKDDHATPEACNCRWQVGGGTDDCVGDNGASEDTFELTNLQTGQEVSRKLLNSKIFSDKETSEQPNKAKFLENCSPLAKDDDSASHDTFKENKSVSLAGKSTTYEEGNSLDRLSVGDIHSKPYLTQESKSLLQKNLDNPVQTKSLTQASNPDGGRETCIKNVGFNQQISVDLQQSQAGKNCREQHPDTIYPDVYKKVNIKEECMYDSSDNIQSAAAAKQILVDQTQPTYGKKHLNGGTSCSSQAEGLQQGKGDFVTYSRVPTGQCANQIDDLPENTVNDVQLSQNSSLVATEDGFESADNLAVTSPDFYRNASRTLHHSKSSQSLLIAKRVRKALRATRTTIIAFTITIGFILSYLPHLILIILRSVKTDFEHHFDDVSLIFYNIFIRSYFANNVINIFVYGTMNLEFRTQILNVWSKMKCSKKRK